MDGDATAYFFNQRIAQMHVKVIHLARCLQMGSDLEYADQSTLIRVLSGRQDMEKG